MAIDNDIQQEGEGMAAETEEPEFESQGEGGEPLLLGFDFGTSWTTVMSNRGHKELLRSVVGYPRDIIGVKLLGAPFVVGEEAFEKRSFVDLRSPLKDGVIREYVERDLEVARNFISHVIESLSPEPDDEVCVIVGVPARATNTNKDLLLQVFEEVVDEVQVISEPFLVAYGQDTLVNNLVIDIGAGTIDLCALKGAMPGQNSQVTVNKAGNFVDEQLEAMITEVYPDIQMNTHVAQKIKEETGYVGVAPSQITADLRANGRPVSYDVTELVGNACEMMMMGIIEGVDTLIQSCPPEDQAEMLRNILIAGGGSHIKGIDKYLQDALVDNYGDVNVTCVQDPTFAVCSGALKLALELPPKYWEQLGSVTDY
jgi:rod shape-determining protein MreB and related proteins